MSTPHRRPITPITWYERRLWLGDALFTFVAGVLLWVGSVATAIDIEPHTVVLATLMLLALLGRRHYPRTFVVAIAVMAYLRVLFPGVTVAQGTDALVLVAVHCAARYGSKRFGYLTLAATVPGTLMFIGNLMRSEGMPSDDPDLTLAWIMLAFVFFAASLISYVLGRTQLGRDKAIRAQMDGLAERTRLLQVEHDQQLRIATEQERGRLAAETHDILAHSLAIIVAQADGALMLAERDPQRSHQALRQIAETSREALAEVRVKVAALRAGNDPASSLEPAKSLADLPGLFETVRSANLRLDVEVDGPLALVPAGPALSAYRVTQEALTNVLKHAGPSASARVRIMLADGLLRIDVTDDGRGAASTPDEGSGSGLRGMRTRVEQYGGTLHAGPSAGGGFAIHATIPVPTLRVPDAPAAGLR